MTIPVPAPSSESGSWAKTVTTPGSTLATTDRMAALPPPDEPAGEVLWATRNPTPPPNAAPIRAAAATRTNRGGRPDRRGATGAAQGAPAGYCDPAGYCG